MIAANGADGVLATANQMFARIMVRSTTIANNGNSGLETTGIIGGEIFLTRSTITGNAFGWDNTQGSVLSYADNNIENNASNNIAPGPLSYQ